MCFHCFKRIGFMGAGRLPKRAHVWGQHPAIGGEFENHMTVAVKPEFECRRFEYPHGCFSMSASPVKKLYGFLNT